MCSPACVVVYTTRQPHKDIKKIHWGIHCQPKIEQRQKQTPREHISGHKQNPSFQPLSSPEKPTATPLQQYLFLLCSLNCFHTDLKHWLKFKDRPTDRGILYSESREDSSKGGKGGAWLTFFSQEQMALSSVLLWKRKQYASTFLWSLQIHSYGEGSVGIKNKYKILYKEILHIYLVDHLMPVSFYINPRGKILCLVTDAVKIRRKNKKNK